MRTQEVTGRAVNDQSSEFLAELTMAAYDVALRYVADSVWLDLELGLWHALTDAAQQWNLEAQRAVVR